MKRARLRQLIDDIEGSYEFFLAYAAQGATGEAAARADGQVREQLEKMRAALAGVADGFRQLLVQEPVTAADDFHAMFDILDRDAQEALVAVRFVMAQPSVTSQLIDTLNSSMHVRATLTDMFLIDEVMGVGES